MKLEPKLWTESGEISLSAKNHMPYFEDEVWVAQYIEWKKIQTLLTTYVGFEQSEKHGGDATGLWQYITKSGCIHPSYWTHRAVTGRISSSQPNGQSIPKRGELAMEYRKSLVARPGYSILELDLSQAELRFAAWMANEKNMIRLYKMGEDIHAATGAAISGIPFAKFKQGQKDDRFLSGCLAEWKGAAHWFGLLSKGKRETVKVSSYMKHLRQQAKAVVPTHYNK